MLRRFAFPAFILAGILLSLPCYAVSMDVGFGFDGSAKASAWSPISVKLSNPDSRSLTGVLQVAQGDRSAWTLPTCSVKVDLPPKSNKLYHMYFRPGQYGDLRIALISRGNVIVRKKVHADVIDPVDKLVVSVGPRAVRPSYLSGESIGQSTIHVGSISVGMLPNRPAAYQGVDILVLSDLSIPSTDSDSLEAIAEWVSHGGTLVVPTGPNYRNFQNGFYSELLPVRITGAGSANLSALGGTAGAIGIASSVPIPGICSSVLPEGGAPLVATRTYGLGSVVFLAFDTGSAPFAGWNGKTEFWKRIISIAHPAPLFLSERPEPEYGYYPGMQISGNDLASVVEQTTSVRTPSMNIIGLFLLVYLLVLAPVNYAVLKRMRRLEFAWFSVPAVVIVFALGAYAIGYTMNGGRLQMNQVTLVEGSSNARYAKTMTCASLFSPARRTYALGADDPRSVIGSFFFEEKEKRALPEVYLSEKSEVENVRMAMWSSTVLQSLSGIDLGGRIETDLMLKSDRIQGRVVNKTKFDLKDCEVVFGDNSLSLGNRRRGASAAVDLRFAGHTQPSPGPSASTPDGNLSRRFHKSVLNRARGTASPILIAKIAPHEI
ncbi:MAG: hypothetical protein ACYC08_08670, partial [Armatimonadota bacterium]